MEFGKGKTAKLPNIVSLTDKELPDIKNWQPGTRYRVTLELEMKGMSFADDTSATFQVMSAKPQYGSGPVKQSTTSKADKSATMSALQRRVGK